MDPIQENTQSLIIQTLEQKTDSLISKLEDRFLTLANKLMNDRPKPKSDLAEALSKAQGQFRTPTLNRTAKIKNAQGTLLYETHYADLQECIDCIKKPLSDNGLSFVQTIEFIAAPKEMWVLKLVLRHASGEIMNSILPLNVAATPQQLGGSLTYFKRYQLSAFFGLAADFDDDGNAAEGKGNKVEGSEKKPPTPPPDKPKGAQGLYKDGKQVDTSKGHATAPPVPKDRVTQAQLNLLNAKGNSKGWKHEQITEYANAMCGVGTTKDLGRREFDIILKVIEASTFQNAMKELK